jgi:hypothetical protein
VEITQTATTHKQLIQRHDFRRIARLKQTGIKSAHQGSFPPDQERPSRLGG